MLDAYHAELVVLGRVCLAVGLGAAIGVERELADKPAGLRTHMLVAGSACLLLGLGDFLVADFADGDALGFLRLDPMRLIEALVTGIAFLGAGTIIRGRGAPGAVEGLTTAASLFFTGIVGVTVATSRYLLAVGATIVLLATLRLVAKLERRLP